MMLFLSVLIVLLAIIGWIALLVVCIGRATEGSYEWGAVAALVFAVPIALVVTIAISISEGR